MFIQRNHQELKPSLTLNNNQKTENTEESDEEIEDDEDVRFSNSENTPKKLRFANFMATTFFVNVFLLKNGKIIVCT